MTSTNDPAYVSDDTGVVLGTLITDQPLESLAAAAYDDVMVASMGACVTFNGVVRNHDGGQRVRSASHRRHCNRRGGICGSRGISAPRCRLSGMLGHGGHR